MSVFRGDVLGVVFFALVSSGCGGGGAKADGQKSVQEMTDALFAVISANRDAYTRHVVDRLQYQERLIEAKEHFREEKGLPLPAQMLRFSAEKVSAEQGVFTYSLLSLWPVNKQNGPRTDSEKTGLRAVAETGKNHYTEEIIDGKRFFTAYYADKAVVQACATCHDEHKDSPRHDFRVGDVMGGIVIRVKVGE